MFGRPPEPGCGRRAALSEHGRLSVAICLGEGAEKALAAAEGALLGSYAYAPISGADDQAPTAESTRSR